MLLCPKEKSAAHKNRFEVLVSLFMDMSKFKWYFYHTHTHTLKTHPVHLLCVWWFLRDALELNGLSQTWHGKFNPSKCISMCSLMWLLFRLILPQVRHRNIWSPSRFIISSIFLSSSSTFSNCSDWNRMVFSFLSSPPLLFLFLFFVLVFGPIA